MINNLSYSSLAPSLSAGNGNMSAAARIFFDIREKIVSMELKPGAALSRTTLATQYGVSQSPIREAIQRLEQEQLVVSFPQSKTNVTKISLGQIYGEHFLRMSAECELVRQLANKHDLDAMKKVKGLMKMQGSLVDDLEQIGLFQQLDNAFHGALFEAAGQAKIFAHISTYCSNMARARGLDLLRKDKMKTILADHKAIVDAINASDPTKAADAMRIHLNGTLDQLPMIQKKWGEFFDFDSANIVG